ncbi:HNH endonuclease [Sulfurimonas sp. HSL-1716]|uniref:HNH endonuclease n=1 Tax=Hydrocurvibacter sulfurireducens TaxID=3131937 RepID=UPI0031F776F8
MPKKICNQVGCNNLISISERYCGDHKRIVSKYKHRIYDNHKRNKDHSKFYHSKEWKSIRETIMERNGGLCKRCQQLDIITNADVVDHIIPITEDYTKRLDLSNLQPLCHSCHNKKTADDESMKGRGA